MSRLWGLQHKDTGLFCTVRFNHKGPHKAKGMNDRVLVSWRARDNRRKTRDYKAAHSEPRHQPEVS